MGSYLSTYVLYPPEKSKKMHEERQLHIENIEIENYLIPAYWFVPKDSKILEDIDQEYIEKKERYTILYSHDEWTDIEKCYDWCKYLAQNLNVNVLCYEYMGYGWTNDINHKIVENDKRMSYPSEYGCNISILSAFNFLVKTLNVSPMNIIVMGISMGTGPSCVLSSKMLVKGLILQSPFMTMLSRLTNEIASPNIDMFKNITEIEKIYCATFIIHGMKDETTSYIHSNELAQLSPNCTMTWFVKNGTHNNIEKLDKKKYISMLSQFIHFNT